MNPFDLRERATQLKEPVTDKKPPYWDYWRWELWKHFTDGDDPYGFMGWPCIYHTMLVNHWKEPVIYEHSQLDIERWKYAASSPHRFHPWDFFGKTTLSSNLIHQAYHLHVWEQKTRTLIEDVESIVEFGAGYGAMALLCHRMGFRGRYYIYDLPEFALLQEFFLSHLDVDNVVWVNNKRRRKVDLLMGIYSLGEVELSVRNSFLDKITSKSYLFLDAGRWENYDNLTWFAQQSHLAENWDTWEIQHLPDRDNWYTVGW